MRFGLIHRIMTGALAVLGMAALVTSGQLGVGSRWSLSLLLVLALIVPDRVQLHPKMRTAGLVLSIGLLGLNGARLFLGHDPLTVAVEFAAGLQIVRIGTRRGGAHDQQIVLLALLHLVAGTVLGGGLAYALCFFGFLVVAPGALVLSHLRREVEGNYRQGARDRTGLPVDVPRILRSRRVVSGRFLLITSSLAVPIFVFTAGLFVAFPRVGLSMLLRNHGNSGRMVGFSDRVDLGKVGRLRSDPTIAMRVYLPPSDEERPVRLPLYLRGTAFDTYDGKSWSRDRGRFPAQRLSRDIWALEPVALGEELMTIALEPIQPPVLFLPSGAAAFEVLAEGREADGLVITRGQEGDVSYALPHESGLRYRALGGQGRRAARLEGAERGRYLTLPPDWEPRVTELARSWVGSSTNPREMASRIERKLRRGFRYDLESPSGSARNPLVDFLFVSQRGHCEYYSTAMATMLRALGVPTRNVTGFIGGTLNRFGDFYAVRQGDAHSWVEVFVDGVGWTRFDPTPGSETDAFGDAQGMFSFFRELVEAAGERWERHVVSYDLQQQLGLLRKLRSGLSSEQGSSTRFVDYLKWLAAAGAAGGAAYFGWLRWQKGRRGHILGSRGELMGRAEEHAAALYLRLEAVLRELGVQRRPETPPLAHARALVEMNAPGADEILSLTERYLAARFGGRALSAEERLDFRRRVAALRELRRSQQPGRTSVAA